MTWSMHTVGWLEVDEPDKASDSFEKNFGHVKEPFKVVHSYLSFHCDFDEHTR